MARFISATGCSRLTALVSCILLAFTPALAQLQEVDPNEALAGESVSAPAPPSTTVTDPVTAGGDTDFGNFPAEAQPAPGSTSDSATAGAAPGMSPGSMTTADGSVRTDTYQKDDLIGAAQGVFGQGAEGLGNIIEDILRKQGEPNGYIIGREGSGAFVVGLRYGSGTLHHKIEGERAAYWTGPSIGFDAGANAGNTFVLVYNLYDSEDLYQRFGAGEAAAYLVGGFHVSYLRRDDVVLIPVRLGVGLRLGANIGYMKFSEKQRWMPF